MTYRDGDPFEGHGDDDSSDSDSSIGSEDNVDDRLSPHGQYYEEMEELVFNESGRNRYAEPARFIFPANEGFDQFPDVEKPIVEYFYLVFPMIFINIILAATNTVLTASNYSEYVKRQLDKGEFLKWIGIRLCMVLTPLRGGIDAYFAVGSAEGTVYEGGNYGRRFGMPKNRFKAIQESLRFTAEAEHNDDPWRPIRQFIVAFNLRMSVVLIPGCFLCIDECMSMWKGMDYNIAGIFGLPHKTKIARKPEGVGCEMKSLADVTTGCLLLLDIMEGRERQEQKEYANLGAGTGTTKRMTKKYHGTNRVCIGDSWFASFLTALELFNVGLFFMGIVKTASRFFPKKFLSEWCEANNARERRGRHKLLRTRKDGVNIYALGWSDKKGKQVVFTTGTTLAAEPSRRRRHKRVLVDGVWRKETYEKVVPRPEIMKELFDGFSAVDVHDHLRQGSIEMEREWITRDWVLRLFGTLLSMIMVNAYLAYRYMTGREDDLNKFLGHLALQLINNKFIDRGAMVLRRRQRDEGVEEVEVLVHEAGYLCQLPLYADLKGTSQRARQRCKREGCAAPTGVYCIQCSDIANNVFVCYCYNTRTCFMQHTVAEL